MNLALYNLQRLLCHKTQTNKQTNMVSKCMLCGSRYGIVVNVQDCDITVSEFKLQLCFDINFQINTLGKGINILLTPARG